MVPHAEITHQTGGRTRLRVAAKAKDRAYFEHVADELSQFSDIESIEAKPLTGSIVIHHRGPLSLVLDFAEAHSLFFCGSDECAPTYPSCFSQAFLEATEEIDAKISRATRGEYDLQSIAIAGLLGAAAWQARRGKLLPAGTALFSQALDLMSQSRRRRYEDQMGEMA